MTQPKGKILVIRGGAIGDFILTLPAIAALRRHFPHAQLEVLGYPHIAGLALTSGLVDAVQTIESRSLAAFFADMGELDDATGRYFARFHVIVSFLYDPTGCFAENVKACTHAQFIQGPHRPDESQSLHATDAFLKPLERLAIFDADPVPRLNFLDTPPMAAPLLAIHPGSGSERKNWPVSHWAKLLAHLMSGTDWNVLLVGGEAEGGRVTELAGPLPSSRVTVVQNQPLPQLGRALQHCGGFVGHDSGITHLAAAVGLAGVALWGDTNQAVWHPRSPAFHVLRATAGLAHLAPETVFNVLRNLLFVRTPPPPRAASS